jgi:hypothetical protein
VNELVELVSVALADFPESNDGLEGDLKRFRGSERGSKAI